MTIRNRYVEICNLERVRLLITAILFTLCTKLQFVSIKHKIRYCGITFTVMPQTTDYRLIICESLRITFIV